MFSKIPARSLLLTFALCASAAAQAGYESDSFEDARFRLGTLAGTTLSNGQDGWLVTDDGGYPPPVSSIALQSAVVRSGARAATWDAASYKAKQASFAHLRTNKIFSFAEELDVELDLRIDQGVGDKTLWGLNMQSAPHPGSSLFYWLVMKDGEIWMLQGRIGVQTYWVQTGVKLARKRWYHTRTLVDVARNTLRLFVDGQQVGSGFQPIAYNATAVHGFTSIVLQDPDQGVLHFDNFRARPRARKPELLTSDLASVAAGARARVAFRLHAPNVTRRAQYLLVGSLSGRSPGLRLGSGQTLPINFDIWTSTILTHLNTPIFDRFYNALDANGWSAATWDSQLALPLAAKGLVLDFAYTTWPQQDKVSEPWSVRVR